MADDAIPCIRCDKPLQNVDPEWVSGNQPYEGTAFHTHGHYGSTIFDPMDGTYLEINVCDECLKALQGTGKVFHRRERKPVLVDDHELVGWCKTPSREYTVWTGNEAPAYEERGNEVLLLEREDVGNADLYPEVEWLPGALAAKEHGA